MMQKSVEPNWGLADKLFNEEPRLCPRSRGIHGAKGIMQMQESPDASGVSLEARHPSPLERPSSWQSPAQAKVRIPNAYRPLFDGVVCVHEGLPCQQTRACPAQTSNFADLATSWRI
jgi:hypothetical protein